jgi:hypothetical protein
LDREKQEPPEIPSSEGLIMIDEVDIVAVAPAVAGSFTLN